MISVPGMTTTRRVMKVERPRPLKISGVGDHSMDTVLSEMDLVAQKLNSGSYERGTSTQIASLCENLKMFGPQLESVYKDQLDRCYVALRNGCRDDRLTLSSRYRLLEVIELRAMNWQPNENLISYYKQKLTQNELDESYLEESQAPDIKGYLNTGAILTPTTPVTAPVFPTQFSSYPQQQQIAYNSQPQQSPQQQVVLPMLPMLGPGEIVKSSGKYAAPVRVPGKNHCKDEIVIRNADSGKVMGLKGRRVHMIEELSETVISFQRVAPGAKERLVQITGTNEDNISQAKQLIEETIRRNASPVRSEERGTLVSHGGSCSSISSHTSDETLQGMKRNSHGVTTIEDNFGEYRYTVTHENDTIRITGNNLELVRTAKLILDEYFAGEKNLNIPNVHLSSESTDSTTAYSSEPHNSTTTASQKMSTEEMSSPNDDESTEVSKSVVTVLRQPIIPSSSKEIIEFVESSGGQDVNKNIRNRRFLFAKTNEEKSNNSQGDSNKLEDAAAGTGTSSSSVSSTSSRIIYSRDFLLRCAASPLCHVPPVNWEQVIRLSPIIAKKEVDYAKPIALLGSQLHWSCLRTASMTDDDDNGNSNNGALQEQINRATEERT